MIPIYRAKKIDSDEYVEGVAIPVHDKMYITQNGNSDIYLDSEDNFDDGSIDGEIRIFSNVFEVDPLTLVMSFNNEENFDSFSFVARAIQDHREETTIEKCNVCSSTRLTKKLLKDRSWMGTKKLPSEFFRKSEYDFGWDYYADGDILQTYCECGNKMYKKVTEFVRKEIL